MSTKAGQLQSQAKSVAVEELQRDFKPGSVAVLAMCSAGGIARSDRYLMEKLNRQGIDAVIATPFPLPIPFAEQFTREFGACLKKRYENHDPTSLYEVISETAVNVVKNAHTAAQKRLAEHLIMEFVVAGDMGITLCGK